MSPEHLRKEAATIGMDIWCLGATMYALLTGQKPYGTPDEVGADTVKAGISSPDPVDLSPLASVAPASLVVVIEKCLQKDPAERYDAMQTLAGDLARFTV